MTDRITYDGDHDHLDEILVDAALVHVERLDQHNWFVQISRGELQVQFDVSDLRNLATIGVPEVFAEPLRGCGHEWRDRFGTQHRCRVRHQPRSRYQFHKCDCGSGVQTP